MYHPDIEILNWFSQCRQKFFWAIQNAQISFNFSCPMFNMKSKGYISSIRTPLEPNRLIQTHFAPHLTNQDHYRPLLDTSSLLQTSLVPFRSLQTNLDSYQTLLDSFRPFLDLFRQRRTSLNSLLPFFDPFRPFHPTSAFILNLFEFFEVTYNYRNGFTCTMWHS